MNSTPNQLMTRVRSAAGAVWASVWRRRKAIGIALIVIVLLHGAATAYLGWRVRSEIAKLKASGQPVTYADLVPQPIPDSENGAVIFAAAFDLMQYKDSRGRIRMRQEYSDALDVLINYLDPVQREKDPALWSKAQQASVTVEGVLALAEEAVARPKCQFPVHAGVFLEHYVPFRGIMRFAIAKASLEASTGNSREAVRYLNLAFRISNSIGPEPTLLCPLGRVSTIRIVFNQLGQILDQCNLDPQSINLLDTTLSRTDIIGAFAVGMSGERAFGLGTYEDLLKCKQRLPMPFWARWISTYPMRPVFYLDELAYIRDMNISIRDFPSPYRNAISGIGDHREPFYAPVAETLLPPVNVRMMASRDKGLAMIAISRTALALAKYRNTFGSYPQSLDELESKLGRKMPEDPFSGKHLVYRIQNPGYLLYSIGQNMKDDGGRMVADPNKYDPEVDITLAVAR